MFFQRFVWSLKIEREDCLEIFRIARCNAANKFVLINLLIGSGRVEGEIWEIASNFESVN